MNERQNPTTAPTITLERDLDAWVDREIADGIETPAFWDGCNTSERLAHYLVALGYVKEINDAR